MERDSLSSKTPLSCLYFRLAGANSYAQHALSAAKEFFCMEFTASVSTPSCGRKPRAKRNLFSDPIIFGEAKSTDTRAEGSRTHAQAPFRGNSYWATHPARWIRQKKRVGGNTHSDQCSVSALKSVNFVLHEWSDTQNTLPDTGWSFMRNFRQ